MKDNRKLLYGLVAFALILSITGISVGFATMSTQLNIEGTTAVTPANWKIRFQNLSTSPTIEGSAKVLTAPTITGDTHIGNYSVSLSKPGDKVVFTFDVANVGDIDATLSSLIIANPTITATGSNNGSRDVEIVSENLVYTFTYANTLAINEGDELSSKSPNNVKSLALTVAYKETASELPVDEVTISGMDITMLYIQK